MPCGRHGLDPAGGSWRRGRAAHYVTGPSLISVVPPYCGAQVRGSCVLPLCVTWRHFVRSLMRPGPSVPSASAHWPSPAYHAVTALKSVSPGSTSPAAMSMDAMTGARDRRERRNQEKAKAPPPVENVPCAGAWVPTCRCGWALSLQCTWMPALPLMLLCHVATSAQRGQPGTGLRHLCPTGRTPSDPSAPSAPLPSAPPAGHGSSSRAPSTNRHSVATATITLTGNYLSCVHVANVDKHVCSLLTL